MEQANYWMWMRRTLSEKSHVETSRNYNDSWEEQAFAEDSAGPLGGCVWPPRSYSCSFCRREFRSAQALGGHMNVHRRDRARLKQSPIPHTENGVIQHQISPSSLLQYPSSSSSSQVCTLSYSNPKFNPTCDDRALVQGHRMLGSLFSRQSPVAAIKVTSLSDSKLEEAKNSRALEIGFGHKSDSDVSLNLAVRRTRPTQSSGDDEDEVISNKRRKVVVVDTASAPLPFFLNRKSSTTPSEEIDLELRLGDRPKVK